MTKIGSFTHDGEQLHVLTTTYRDGSNNTAIIIEDAEGFPLRDAFRQRPERHAAGGHLRRQELRREHLGRGIRLFASGLFATTKQMLESGHVTVPVWKLKEAA